MAPIRILLVAMPRLMRDVVEAEVAGRSDMTLVGTADDTTGLVEAVRAGLPDFVLLGADHGDDLHALFEARPQTRVIEIEVAARSADAHLYELRPRRLDLGAVSPAEVVSAIRETAFATGPRWGAS